MKKYLYVHKKTIDLTFGTAIGRNTMNFGWGDADTIIHKGYDNIIEFSIRDIDRRPVKIFPNFVLEARFFNNTTDEFLFSKRLEITDSSRGKAKLTLSPQDLINIPVTTLRYTVVMMNLDTEEEFPLSNDYSGIVHGYLQVSDSVDIKPVNPIIIEELTPITIMNDSFFPETWLTTGSIRGTIQRSISKNLMTVAIYFDNFSGKLKAEGTLEATAPSNNNNDVIWDTLLLSGLEEEKIYENFTGIDSFNFYGNFNWFRILFKEDQNNSGKITKVIAI